MWLGIDTGCLQRSSCPQLRSEAPPPMACTCTTLLAPWTWWNSCQKHAPNFRTRRIRTSRCMTPTFAANQQLTVSQSGHKPTPHFGQPYLAPQKRSTTVPAASVWITCLRNATRIQGVKKFPDEDAGPTTSRTLARHGVQPICKSWNYSHCVSATCAYRHVCLECRENHRIVQCPTNRRFQPYPKAKPGEEGRGMARRQAFRGQRDFNPR